MNKRISTAGELGKYKLLKDLPTFKAGDIFTLTENGALRLKQTVDERNEGKLILVYSAQTLEKFPEILKEWFEEIPEEYKRWRANAEGLYFYLFDDGDICSTIDLRFSSDNFRYYVGNYFKTREEAEKYREYQIALQTLKDDTKGFVPNWDDENEKWTVSYDCKTREFVFSFSIEDAVGRIVFKTREDAQNSTKLHEKEWKIVLGVEK